MQSVVRSCKLDQSGCLRVWLVTVGESLPLPGSGARLLRAGILSGILARQGHQVVWWTSTFDHWQRRHLFNSDTELRLANGVVLRLLHGCGYRRNISIRRIVDHILVARSFSRLANREPAPDVILCSLPTLELSIAATRYGIHNNVPVIVDIRDLWPDIMLEAAPKWARVLARFALFPMYYQAGRACRDAYAITGNSPPFVDWGLGQANREATALDRSFPFGYFASPPKEHDLVAAERFWGQYGLTEGRGSFIACFFGTMGHQFDLDTVLDAALMLESEGRDILFVLCGVGERLDALKIHAGQSRVVIFPGWVGHAEIYALMRMASIGLAPYRNHAGFIGNLPNKPIEYLAGGLPVLSSLDGYLGGFLARHGCGLTYPDGEARALHDILLDIYENRQKLKKMALNARAVFAEQFDADRVYGGMSDYLREVVSAYRMGSTVKQ